MLCKQRKEMSEDGISYGDTPVTSSRLGKEGSNFWWARKRKRLLAVYGLLNSLENVTPLSKRITRISHNIKWDHFEILATGKSDLQCKIKETLLISELKPGT